MSFSFPVRLNLCSATSRQALYALFVAALMLAGCSTASPMNRNTPEWTTSSNGDTLYRIAQRYNRTLTCVQRYNPTIRANALAVGQQILLPSDEECASLSTTKARYRVRRNDTLYAIAARFQQTPQALAAANSSLPHNPRLNVGQWLNLPSLQRSAVTQSSRSTPRRQVTATHSTSTVGTHAASPSPVPLPNALQQRPWPLLEPRVIREFGPDERGRLQPMMLAARASQTATAIANGSVQFASTMRQLGHVVVVHHAGGIQAVYAHCGTIAVHVGQRVKAGTPLCQVAQDDATASPQLLFDIRQAGRPINPRRLLK